MREKNLADCLKIASDLGTYASVDFSHSIQPGPGQNLTNPLPLGLGFTEWVSIDTIGLEVPASTVPPAIIPMRDQLTVTYLESVYYLSMTNGFTNYTYASLYPTSDPASKGFLDHDLETAIASMKTKAQNNLDVLNNPGAEARAQTCWSEPDESCELWVVTM